MSKVDLSRLLQLFTSIYGYLRYIKKCFVLIGIAESMDHRRCLWCVACIFLILALQRPQSIHLSSPSTSPSSSPSTSPQGHLPSPPPTWPEDHQLSPRPTLPQM
ncbi:uncharacterized protein [Aegilops tauschii subsp. strangulata]|uniref:uncharacterized protein isoform X2 n=1 Tax=Aegilops tauschii subsp. strangulata TaxID=200361 RepID=UPI003CC83DD1